jgi:hypothetical protein
MLTQNNLSGRVALICFTQADSAWLNLKQKLLAGVARLLSVICGGEVEHRFARGTAWQETCLATNKFTKPSCVDPQPILRIG